MKYKSTDLEVEAIEYTGNVEEVQKFCEGNVDVTYPEQTSYPTPFLYLNTPIGEVYVNHSDFIVKFQNGDLYAICSALFNTIYKPSKP